MLPVVMGPHTVGKVTQPSFSIKGRSKLGSFSDDLHKARAPPPQLGQKAASPPGDGPPGPSPRAQEPPAWPHSCDAPPPSVLSAWHHLRLHRSHSSAGEGRAGKASTAPGVKDPAVNVCPGA